jgi:hypothetical protein
MAVFVGVILIVTAPSVVMVPFHRVGAKMIHQDNNSEKIFYGFLVLFGLAIGAFGWFISNA